MTTLQTGGTALAGSVAALQSDVSCVKYKVLPVGQYGGSGGQGYLYTNNSGTSIFITSALDVVPSGQTPGASLAVVNPSCVAHAFASGTASSDRDSRSVPLVGYSTARR